MGNFKRYIVLWVSQSISQLGSSMTAFALILWTYEQTGSALSVSIMSFCNYVPYILISRFVGTFVDVLYNTGQTGDGGGQSRDQVVLCRKLGPRRD